MKAGHQAPAGKAPLSPLRAGRKKLCVFLRTLGCPKNLVDAEAALGILRNNGFLICDDPADADVMLLNTCAFIKEAKEESIDFIFELAKIKKMYPAKKIVVMGCLPQRYIKELIKDIPEVDLWVLPGEIPEIHHSIRNLLHKYAHPAYPPTGYRHFLYNAETPRYMITPKHYAYIKISGGCSNNCTYCAIPGIKGSYRSRPEESILKEAEGLVRNGVKEINIIGQDITSYGTDTKTGANLAKLVHNLCGIKGIRWIRLLYMHPAHITSGLLKEIALQDKICKYIDMPLQHIDNDILGRMGRKPEASAIRGIIKEIRKCIPDAVLRTSFIVGFPGETEKQFDTLLAFMQEVQFERLGIFRYSREDGTPAYSMPGQIKESVKDNRFHRAMSLQNKIAKKVNKKFIDKRLNVLIDGRSDKDPSLWAGRTYADAPEVDGLVYVRHSGFKPGDMVKLKITGTTGYDLTADEPAE